MRSLSERLSRDLALSRTDYLARLRSSRLAKKDYGKARLFLDLKFLAAEEERLSGRLSGRACSVPDLPFHHLLCALSGFYANVFRMAEVTGIPFVATLKSPGRSVIEFDPFALTSIEFPGIKKELHWLLRQPPDRYVIAEFANLLTYNFAAFHECLHRLLAILIPPPGNVPTRSYHHFIESMALTQERYLSAELGPVISDVLRSFDTVRRTYGDSGRLIEPARDRQTEFRGLLLTHFGYLRKWSRSKMRNSFPTKAPFLDNPDVFVRPDFVSRYSPRWLRRHPKLSYPRTLTRKLAEKLALRNSTPQLKLKDFRLEVLSNDAEALERISRWHESVFRKGRRGK